MKKILFLLFVILLSYSSQASRIIGGKITWTCDKDPMSASYGNYNGKNAQNGNYVYHL